ncbi:MAG: hypothetical protein NT091_02680 [Candidatus Falkowbacteria bacterium]|nr:hypothetical protein [Candidatus Falkowbacteria bacterium]
MVKIDSITPEEYVKAGIKARTSQNHAAADKLFNLAVSSHRKRGDGYLSHNNFNKAIENYKEVIKFQPGNVYSYQNTLI